MRSTALYNEVQTQVHQHFRTLRLVTDNGVAFIRGALPIGEGNNSELDRYQIEIELPEDFPNSLPTVKETAGKIPRNPDRHINDDGTACLFVREETAMYWNRQTSLADFISGPVYQFFLGQTYYTEHGDWPFGQREHGAQGIAQFYFDELGTTSLFVVTSFLGCLTNPAWDRKRLCYCGSKKTLSYCHLNKVVSLRAQIPQSIARDSLKQINSLLRSSAKKKLTVVQVRLAQTVNLLPPTSRAVAVLCGRYSYKNLL